MPPAPARPSRPPSGGACAGARGRSSAGAEPEVTRPREGGGLGAAGGRPERSWPGTGPGPLGEASVAATGRPGKGCGSRTGLGPVLRARRALARPAPGRSFSAAAGAAGPYRTLSPGMAGPWRLPSACVARAQACPSPCSQPRLGDVQRSRPAQTCTGPRSSMWPLPGSGSSISTQPGVTAELPGESFPCRTLLSVFLPSPQPV